MQIIIGVHKIDRRSDHYREVLGQMRSLGSPVIRAISSPYGWLAIEGSHRLAAAQELGLPVRIKDVGGQQVLRHDLQDLVSPCSSLELQEYLLQGLDSAPEYCLEVIE